MKAKEVLKVLRITKQRLSQLVKEGRIKTAKEGDYYNYNEDDVYLCLNTRLVTRIEKTVNHAIRLLENGNKDKAKTFLIDSILDIDTLSIEHYFKENPNSINDFYFISKIAFNEDAPTQGVIIHEPTF